MTIRIAPVLEKVKRKKPYTSRTHKQNQEQHSRHKQRETDSQMEITEQAILRKWVLPGRKPPKKSIDDNGCCVIHGTKVDDGYCDDCLGECASWQYENGMKGRRPLL